MEAMQHLMRPSTVSPKDLWSPNLVVGKGPYIQRPHREGEGVAQTDIVREVVCAVDHHQMWTRGEVKNTKNFADILNVWSLRGIHYNFTTYEMTAKWNKILQML